MEAAKYHVLPIDDRSIERLNASLAGRPDLMGGQDVADALRRHEGHAGKCLHQREEPLNDDHGGRGVPKGGANGVILAQGGRFGGWSFYVKGGRPAYDYNFLGMKRTTITAHEAGSGRKGDGANGVRLRRGRSRQGRPGDVARERQEGRRGTNEQTIPMMYSTDEGADVGVDEGTPVVEDFSPKSTKFTGTIRRVVVDVKAMGAGERAESKKAAAETAHRIEAAK